MSLLLAKPAQDEMRRLDANESVPLSKVIEALKSLDARYLDQNPNVSRMENAEGGIYVMRVGKVRIFFSRKDNDIVVLSITSR